MVCCGSISGTIIDFTPGRAHVHPCQGKADRKRGKPRSRWIKPLGKHDQIVEWFKSPNRPQWMSEVQYAELPTFLVVRELRNTIQERGFRPTKITLVTTLLDARRYPLSALAARFGQRWEIETNFGHSYELSLVRLRVQSIGEMSAKPFARRGGRNRTPAASKSFRKRSMLAFTNSKSLP